QLAGALERIARAGAKVRMTGVFTTLSCSDDPHDAHTTTQLATFASSVEAIRRAGHRPECVHAANSGGVLDHPPSWLDAVRPGIMLYGVHPSAVSHREDLRPALSLVGRLALVKSVPAGTPIGYGRAFVTARPSAIGTVPLGYADGLFRKVASHGHAL